MIYYFLKLLVSITLRVFFRNFYVQNRKAIPKDGPLILVANHPSTFLDPLIIAAITRRKVYFLAKGSLFKNGFLRWFFKHLNMIPVYRAQDDAAQMNKNTETFDKCYEHLEKNGVILIFPEGISITEKKLKPLKTGAARIALGAEARNQFKLGVTLLPIGLNYENPHQFRKNVLINIGEPIAAKSFEDAFIADPYEAAQELTSTTKEQLESLIISIDDKQQENLSVALFDIYKTEINKEGLSINESTVVDYKLQKKIAEGVKYFAYHQYGRFQNMVNRVNAYHTALSQLGLSEKTLNQHNNRLSWTLQILRLFTLFPLFVVGYVLNFIPYYTAPIIAKKISAQLEYQGPISMLVGMVLYLVNYSMIGVLAFVITHTGWMIPIIILAIFILGLFAYWYAQTFLALQHKWRLMRLFLTKQKLVSKLIIERELIIAAIETAAAETRELRHIIWFGTYYL